MRFCQVTKDSKCLVKGELLTLKEIEKIFSKLIYTYYNGDLSLFLSDLLYKGDIKSVNISKFKTYWNFGCRFPYHDEMKGIEK